MSYSFLKIMQLDMLIIQNIELLTIVVCESNRCLFPCYQENSEVKEIKEELSLQDEQRFLSKHLK